MDEWTDGPIDGWMDGRIYRQTDGWMVGWINEQMEGRIDR
jgi:hypothetical protein